MRITTEKYVNRVCFMLVLLIAFSLQGNSFAQAPYPNKPITLYHPFVGGASDVAVREIIKDAGKDLGQPINLEFKAGANGTIASATVAKSAPDGYIIGITSASCYLNVPHMTDLPYNSLTGLTDIIALFQNTYGLTVRTSSPWNTYEELIAFARKNPNKLKYATIGAGSAQHIAMSRIAEKEGIQWIHIPFKNEGECLSACLGEHVDICTQTPIASQGQIDAGKLRLLMVLTDAQWPGSPKTPNMPDKGYDFYAIGYISVIGPGKLPEPIRNRLENAFTKALKGPAYNEVIKKYGLDARSIPGKAYSDLWRKQYDSYGKVIKAAGLGK